MSKLVPCAIFPSPEFLAFQDYSTGKGKLWVKFSIHGGDFLLPLRFSISMVENIAGFNRQVQHRRISQKPISLPKDFFIILPSLPDIL
jgi:hypothetical protein